MARAGWTVGVLAAVLAVASVVQVGQAAGIVGIDFGTNFIKAAYVQPGKAFDIVLNDNSKRKTPNAIGFDRGARLYGTDAMSLGSREPANVLLRSRDLLGTTKDSEQIRHLEDALGIKYDYVDDEETGGFKVVLAKGTSHEVVLRPEEAVGMLLSNIKRMTAKYTETDVSDCVITVPSFFTQSQREALLSAAEIAGFNVLTLVDENVAAAVQHGIYTEFTNASHKVLVYNMGSASTKVSLINFWGKPSPGKGGRSTTQVEVLAKAWDETLGGDLFDMTMVDMIIDAFDKMHMGAIGSTVRASRRAFERIRRQATAVKTVLSANMEIPVSIESLFKGKDLRMHVTRKEFEDQGKSLFDRVVAPIETVLKAAGITLADLHAVELIGGGIRVPRVKDMLSEYLQGMELGNHLNGDEAKAFGAVFVGANMSKTFRVRPVGLVDITTDAVSVQLTDPDDSAWTKNTLLFNASSPLDVRKLVGFKHKGDVVCTLLRGTQDGAAGTPVAEYRVSGLADAIEKFGQFGEPKISLTFHLSSNDTVVLPRAEAQFVEEIPAEPEAPEAEGEGAENATAASEEAAAADDGAAASSKAAEGDGEAAADAAEDASEAAAEDGKEADAGESSAEAKDAKDSKKGAKKGKKDKPKGPTKKTHRFKLTVTRTDSVLKLKPLGPEGIAAARALLVSYDSKEEAQRLHEAAKNELEGYIFGSRDKVRSSDEEVDQVMTAEDKEKLFEDLEALEDWLDDEEGSNAPVEEYKKRRGEIEKQLRKIFKRIDELDQRPATVRAARKLVATIRTQVGSHWAKERPWITEPEKQLVLSTTDAFEAWLDARVAEQDATSLQQDPLLTAADVAAQLEQLHDIFETALKRAPPRPPAPKKPAKKKSPKAKDKGKDGAKEAEGASEAEPEAEAAGKADEESGAAGSSGAGEGAEEATEEKDEL